MDDKPAIELICDDFLQTPPESICPVDLVFCDIFDNIGTGYDNFKDKMPEAKYEQILEAWLVKCCAITTGPVFFSFNEKWLAAVEGIIRQRNLLLVQRIWWTWTFGQNQKRRYTPSIRPIYWLNNYTMYPQEIRVPSAREEKYGDKRAKPGGKMPDNVWQFPRVCGTYKERRRWHPCQIPEAVLDRIILGHTLPGATVFDPCVGSGTTAIVCRRTNRNFVGVDISPTYIGRIRTLIREKEDGPRNTD